MVQQYIKILYQTIQHIEYIFSHLHKAPQTAHGCYLVNKKQATVRLKESLFCIRAEKLNLVQQS